MTIYIQGQPTTVTGIVPNAYTSVQVGCGQSSTTPPTQLVDAVVVGTQWTATVTPNFSGTGYLWVIGSITLAPQILLRISYDKGRTFGDAVGQSIGALGEYLTAPSWRRLGLGRDVVFQLEWSFAGETALNGAFVDLEELNT